jgi:tetratricopeptide repeat protein
VALATGDCPGAARNLQEALGIFRDLGHRLGQVQALTGLGRVALATGNYSGAARDLQEALDLARQMGISLDVSAELDALRSAPDPASSAPG